MWYFSWILGTALAVSFGILNALWHELKNEHDHHSCNGSGGCHGKKVS